MRAGPAAPATAVSAAESAPVDVVRVLLQHLADIAALAEGRERRDVTRLAPHALGDQLAVLVGDVLALVPPVGPLGAEEVGDVARRLTELRRALP